MSDRTDFPEDRLDAAIEALLFASPEPVRPKDIAIVFEDEGIDLGTVRESLSRMEERFASRGGGLALEQVAGGYRLATRPEVGSWIRKYFRERNRTRLTPATLEVLAIVAYRQPITAPEIQAVRGKDPTYALKVLLEKRMIRVLGRKKVVGNPLLYGTTKHFLVHFGLNALSDLPSIEEFDTVVGVLDEAQASLLPGPTEAVDDGEPSADPAADAPSDEAPAATGEENGSSADPVAIDGGGDAGAEAAAAEAENDSDPAIVAADTVGDDATHEGDRDDVAP